MLTHVVNALSIRVCSPKQNLIQCIFTLNWPRITTFGWQDARVFCNNDFKIDKNSGIASSQTYLWELNLKN